MAVALDVLSGPGGTGAGGHFFSGTGISGTGATVASFINISAGATFLVVGLAINDASANIGTVSMHWDSAGTNQSMTICGTAVQDGAGDFTVFVFGLVNPTSGAKSLKFTFSGGGAGDAYEIVGASWTGTVTSSVAAATEGYATNTATASPATVTTAVSIPTGDAVFTMFANGSGFTGVFNTTAIDTDGTQFNVAASRGSGAGSAVTSTANVNSSAVFAAATVGLKAGSTFTWLMMENEEATSSTALHKRKVEMVGY